MSPVGKSTERLRAYLLAGDDDYRKKIELDKLLKKLVADDFADFDLEQMEGDSTSADRIMAGLAIPPFSSAQRVVLVKFANKMDESEQKKLARRLADSPSTGCLIMVTPAPDKSDGRAKRGDEMIGDMSRAIRKVGSVINTGAEKGRARTQSARDFALSVFTDAGKKINEGALSAFVQRVGTDFSVLRTEAEKLISYSGDCASIKPADISQVTSETPEEKVFKLVDAIAAHHSAEAMRYLDELFETGDRPESEAPKVLANIARTYRLIWQYKLLSSSGVRVFRKDSVSQNLQSLLPSNPNLIDLLSRQSWQEGRLRSQSSRVTHRQLTRSFEVVAEADARLKGIEEGMEDARMVMEMLVLELSGR